MAMLEVNDINVYYGSIHAIKGVSFEVNEGEIISLIGANGAGKTTILQTVSNLLHSKTGSIKFLEEEIHHLPAHKLVPMGLAQVPEGRRVFSQMSVEENLTLAAQIVYKDIKSIDAKVEEMLNLLNIEPIRSRKGLSLSGVAREIAGKFVAGSLDDAAQAKLIDEALNEMGEDTWQN